MDTNFYTGLKTLKTINQARKFNQWMYNRIRPYLHGNTLEIGSGIGNIAKYALDDGVELTLSDYQTTYLDFLSNEFKMRPNAKGFMHIDLNGKTFEEDNVNLKESFNSIFMLNVLEHVLDDAAAIKNCFYLLKPGGNLTILVPAFSFLYSSLDRELGHHRRYTKSSLKTLFDASAFEVKDCFYFNALGIPGWGLNKILKRKEISDSQIKAFDFLVPLARLVDKAVLNRVGLSVLIVGKKKY